VQRAANAAWANSRDALLVASRSLETTTGVSARRRRQTEPSTWRFGHLKEGKDIYAPGALNTLVADGLRRAYEYRDEGAIG